MKLRINWQDLIGGLLLLALAAGAGFMAWDLEIGTARRMGPGYFPMLAAIVLGLCGLLIGGIGLFSASVRLSRPDWGPLASVILSGGGFVLGLSLFGLLPAVALTLAIAALFDRRLGLWASLGLIGFFCIASWLVFIKALGLPIELWKWPSRAWIDWGMSWI